MARRVAHHTLGEGLHLARCDGPLELLGQKARHNDRDEKHLAQLVIAGRYDTVTVLSHSEAIAAAVPGAKLAVLPAVHLSNVEYPTEFVEAVLGFLR